MSDGETHTVTWVCGDCGDRTSGELSDVLDAVADHIPACEAGEPVEAQTND